MLRVLDCMCGALKMIVQLKWWCSWNDGAIAMIVRVGAMSGRLAQMVERPLRMREVGGSIPPVSNLYSNLAVDYAATYAPIS